MRHQLERSLNTAGLHHRRKKKRTRASHSHLSPFIVHDAQSDEIFHVRRGLTATTILCPCFFCYMNMSRVH